MASVEELTSDSVPDPPRKEVSSDESSHNSDSSDRAREDPGNRRHSGKKSSPPQEKRRSSHPSSKPHSNFNIPRINTPGGASVICINNAGNVHLGNSISVNIVGQAFPTPRPSKSPSPEARSTEKPKDVKDACKSTVPVTFEDLDAVTEHVGSRWMKLGERLGYSEEQMERFYEDHHDNGLREVVYQMLLDWKQFKGPEAQVGLLCKSLWGSRFYVAAEKLAARHSEKAL